MLRIKHDLFVNHKKHIQKLSIARVISMISFGVGFKKRFFRRRRGVYKKYFKKRIQKLFTFTFVTFLWVRPTYREGGSNPLTPGYGLEQNQSLYATIHNKSVPRGGNLPNGISGLVGISDRMVSEFFLKIFDSSVIPMEEYLKISNLEVQLCHFWKYPIPVWFLWKIRSHLRSCEV